MAEDFFAHVRGWLGDFWFLGWLSVVFGAHFGVGLHAGLIGGRVSVAIARVRCSILGGWGAFLGTIRVFRGGLCKLTCKRFYFGCKRFCECVRYSLGIECLTIHRMFWENVLDFQNVLCGYSTYNRMN